MTPETGEKWRNQGENGSFRPCSQCKTNTEDQGVGAIRVQIPKSAPQKPRNLEALQLDSPRTAEIWWISSKIGSRLGHVVPVSHGIFPFLHGAICPWWPNPAGLPFSSRTWSTATSPTPRSRWRRVPCCRSSSERCSCWAAFLGQWWCGGFQAY